MGLKVLVFLIDLKLDDVLQIQYFERLTERGIVQDDTLVGD